MLYDSYTRQQVSVSWDNSKWRFFGVTNGVICNSGVFRDFTQCDDDKIFVYIDELLVLLSKSTLGWHVGSCYIGALGYADDRTLIRHSVCAMNQMLSICKSFAAEYNNNF